MINVFFRCEKCILELNGDLDANELLRYDNIVSINSMNMFSAADKRGSGVRGQLMSIQLNFSPKSVVSKNNAFDQ